MPQGDTSSAAAWPLGSDARSAARRGPRWVSAPVLLVEIRLDLPALPEGELDQRLSAGLQQLGVLVAAFRGAVEASAGRFLGAADLDLLACWVCARGGVNAAARDALEAVAVLARAVAQLDLEVQLRVAALPGTGLVGSFGGLTGRWLELVTGSVAERLAVAMSCCRSGELVTASELPLAWLPTPEERATFRVSALSSLPGPGQETALESTLVPGLELSPCSVTSFEICGLDAQLSDHPQRLHAVARTVQRCARRYGCVSLELRHDHRGLHGACRFGARTGEHARAALRALRFGQELGQALADQGLDMPAAVASGTAWVLELPSCTVLLGTAMQRSQALARSTPSELVCDTSTASLAGRRARLERLPTSPAARDIRRFVVEHVDPPRTKRWAGASGIVGRREELMRLEQVGAEFLAGAAGVLLIEGELGMGKSRLADELVQRLRAEPCRVVVAYGTPGASAAPLAPWRGVLLQLLELDECAGPRACQERLQERLGGASPEQLAVIAALLPIADSGEPQGGRPLGNTIEQLAALMSELQGGQPLAVLLEDAQWLDSASWALARELVLRGDELLLVVALRTDRNELQLEAQRLAALPETQVLQLRGLEAEALPALVQRELGITGVPERVLQTLRQGTGGNALLCLEWLRQLLDEGLLRVVDGRVTHSPSSEQLAGQPLAGISALLIRRVTHLPPELARSLAVCSVVGGVFETSLLADVHPDSPGRSRIEAQLEHLATGGLIQPAPGSRESAWCITHDAVHRAVQDLLPGDDLKALHAAVASWYEQRRDDIAPLYPLLAQRWVGAGDLDKALQYLELAGGQAMRSGAMPEAVRHFQTALRLEGDTAGSGAHVSSLRRAHWERSLGDAHYACGDLERCAVHYDRALVQLGHRQPRGPLGAAWSALWQLGVQLGHLLLPSRLFVAPPERHARLLEASHAAERLAERFYYSANAVALASSSVLSANLADRTGDRGRNARPYASLSYLVGLGGLETLGTRLFERAERIGEQAPDPAGLAVARFTRANLRLGQARWDEAEELSRLAVVDAEGAMAWQEAGVARTMLANCAFMRGAFDEAEMHYVELLGLARDRYNAQHESWALYGIGECQLLSGRLHQARRSVRQALAVLGNIEDHPSRLTCHGLLACIHARLGNPERAREAADLCWSLQRRSPPFVLPTIEGASGVCEAYLMLWERERAAAAEHSDLRSRARAAVRTLGAYGMMFPVTRPRHLLAMGQLARIEGRHARAMKLYGRAHELADRLGTPHERARAWAAMAACPGVDPNRAERLRDDARRAFEGMGCGWHLQQLDDQQGQSQ